MTDQNAPAALERVFLWLGQPADEPEHLLMMLVDGGEEDGSQVYRPLLAVSVDHAHQLTELAQQASDGLGVPVVLREYVATDGGTANVDAVLSRLEPRS